MQPFLDAKHHQPRPFTFAAIRSRIFFIKTYDIISTPSKISGMMICALVQQYSKSMVSNLLATPFEFASGFFARAARTLLDLLSEDCLRFLPCARLRLAQFGNYTSVDPKQFTVSKFRWKPVILISECFCSRCGHTKPTPTPHMKGDDRRHRETRPLQSPKRRPHQPTPTPPHEGRQPETTGDKTTSEPKKAATPSNTHPPHEGRQPETTGDNGRQDHFRAQEADHTNQHQGGQI